MARRVEVIQVHVLLAKAEATLWCIIRGVEGERATGVNIRCRNSGVHIFFVREVLVHDIKRFLINVDIVVLLEVVNGDHAASFLDELCVLVDGAWSRGLPVALPNFQDVVQTIKSHLDDFIIHHREQIAKRLDTALCD